MRYKHYYKLLNESCVGTYRNKNFASSFLDWRSNVTKIYQITKDNKLRQFLFKILHRIIITKEELKKCNIAMQPTTIAISVLGHIL